MKRKLGRPRRGAKKLFLLTQILPMKPYVVGLMRDLRATRIRQERLKRLATPPASSTESSYEERRRRHEAIAEVGRLEREEASLVREFRKLGVRVGNVLRGEMLFPCLVDNKNAFFVWFDSEERPVHWRFRGEPELHQIPERWFSLFSGEKQSRKVEDLA